MGNCLDRSAKGTAEITPWLFFNQNTRVKLQSPANDIFYPYVRFALFLKSPRLSFTLIDGSGTKPSIQIGRKTVCAPRELVVKFIDERLAGPKLAMPSNDEGGFHDENYFVRVVVLQHRSMMRHLTMMLDSMEGMKRRSRDKGVESRFGIPAAEMEHFVDSYTQFKNVMIAHAQMEERVLFPHLQTYYQSSYDDLNDQHAKHLPIINGISQGINSVKSLFTESNVNVYNDALDELITIRLVLLKENLQVHFEEEEEILHKLATAMNKSSRYPSQFEILKACLSHMLEAHSKHFRFVVDGLAPWEAMHYLDLISNDKAVNVIHVVNMLDTFWSRVQIERETQTLDLIAPSKINKFFSFFFFS